MVNLESILKVINRDGIKEDWPIRVKNVLERLEEMKKGFPGIRNEHMNLTRLGDSGPLFIWDPYLFSEDRGDLAPVMLNEVGKSKYIVIGVGQGTDEPRDKHLDKYSWGTYIPNPLPDWFKAGEAIDKDTIVLSVQVRPKEGKGGPGYYYFWRSYRDFRR